MTCKERQYGDEMQCSCGLTWGVGETKPACREVSRVESHWAAANRRRGQYNIAKLRKEFKR